MRILFVKPNMGLVDGKPYLDRGRMEPLTFAVLAGFTPAEHEVVLCDDRFEPVPYDEHVLSNVADTLKTWLVSVFHSHANKIRASNSGLKNRNCMGSQLSAS